MRNIKMENKKMGEQEMTEQVKMYFKQLEEKSKDNPMLRIYEASGFITRFLEPIFKTPNGIKGDAFCYMLTTMAGISVAVTAKENSGKNMLENQEPNLKQNQEHSGWEILSTNTYMTVPFQYGIWSYHYIERRRGNIMYRTFN